ncbi:MAG: 2-hydroxyacyl-CoA dehydratase, partial [Ruminococcus sp.]|nr:2-hydroxyacyl-CoA dehydratase [Ruminococcus sp.]
ETFELLKAAFASENVKVVLLKNSVGVINSGLEFVHNDLCCPCAIMVGQLVNALRSGRYDVRDTAFLCAQAGDSCRGSNYIPLIRKAVKKAGFDIPVLSLNFFDMEQGARFDITPTFLLKALAAVMYSDLLMILKNQIRPYELHKGQTDELCCVWHKRLRADIFKGTGLICYKSNFVRICRDFASIEKTHEKKVRVGFVGELYMKYCSIGNHSLLRHYEERGAEVRVNGFSWYVLYYIDSHLYDFSPVITAGYKIASRIIEGVQKLMIRTLRKYGFECFDSFTPFKRKAQSRIPCRCTTGDGWLIGAEIVNHALSGTKGVACLQPFGCMPNHVCGHGLYSSIQRRLSDTGVRLVSVDFDSSGSEVNIYNRAEMLLTPMIINNKKGEKI